MIRYSSILQNNCNKYPIYCNDCTTCGSKKTSSILNIQGSIRFCNDCKFVFNPKIIRYFYRND